MYTNANSVDKVDTLSFLQDQTLGINALKSQNFEIFQAMCEGKKKASKAMGFNSPELGSELPSASVLLSGEACS